MDLTQSLAGQEARSASAPMPGGNEKRASLTSDYEMFLQMLTTQMTNQDPLNPVDSSDYAVQLATFSSVEQQVLTNELLTDLAAALGSSGLADLAGYVGRSVRTQSPAYFDGVPIDLVPNIPKNADAATLSVRDASGRVVQEFDLEPGTGGVAWGGTDADGNQVPAGIYSFEVTSYEDGEIVDQSLAGTYARIIEAQSTPGGMELILSGGIVTSPADITAMRE